MIFNLTPPESTAVEFIEQALTDAQKAQARTNIGALAIDDVPGGGMELLGEAYVGKSASYVGEIQVPIPSGYTYYYMPLAATKSLDRITISYASQRQGNPNAVYMGLHGDNTSSTITYDQSTGGYDTMCQSITFKNISYGQNEWATGYLTWHIIPYGDGYTSIVRLFWCAPDRLYCGHAYDDSDVYTLSQCTPTKIAISGAYSLVVGTGVTVYGIK